MRALEHYSADLAQGDGVLASAHPGPSLRSQACGDGRTGRCMHSCIYNGWVRHRRYEPDGT